MLFLADILPGDDQVRVVPSIRGKKGSIWSKYQFPYENWEIEVHIRIEGKGKVGADGMVIKTALRKILKSFPLIYKHIL